jgi:hypothetical protein
MLKASAPWSLFIERADLSTSAGGAFATQTSHHSNFGLGWVRLCARSAQLVVFATLSEKLFLVRRDLCLFGHLP